MTDMGHLIIQITKQQGVQRLQAFACCAVNGNNVIYVIIYSITYKKKRKFRG